MFFLYPKLVFVTEKSAFSIKLVGNPEDKIFMKWIYDQMGKDELHGIHLR